MCLTQPIQMQYLQIEKHLPHFFLHFRDLRKIFNALKENMRPRGDLFMKL